MKELYKSPVVEVLSFSSKDIMLLSSALNDYDDLAGGLE